VRDDAQTVCCNGASACGDGGGQPATQKSGALAGPRIQMANLKDQIQREISKERQSSEEPGQPGRRGAVEPSARLDAIRPRLDELPHATDKYRLKAEYAVGPYSSDIAIVELYGLNDVWVARWEIAPTVGGSAAEWEITCKPDGAQTYHKWFRSADELFDYLASSIAERVIEMETDEEGIARD
jgi:hypothetical protein